MFITNELILCTVSEVLNISIADILKLHEEKNATKSEFVKARQFCIYLSRKYIKDSQTVTGKYFNRNHSTILYAERCIEKFCRNEFNYQMQLKECEKRLLNKIPDFHPQDVEVSAENLAFQPNK